MTSVDDQTDALRAFPEPFDEEVFAGDGAAIRLLRLQISRIAPHFRMALIVGERGTGKQAVALHMHRASPSAARPFTVIPSSEFALASAQHPSSGTVYLPGLEALPSASQLLLLRALKGLNRETRVVVASETDLKGMVSAGRMRPDLYERVGTLQIRTPALRDRPEDLNSIAHRMLRRMASEATLTRAALTQLEAHTWPGNLHELWALCEQLAALSVMHLGVGDLPDFEVAAAPVVAPARLEDVMFRHVMDVLESCAGNKLRAAELLGISRSTLYRMLGAAAPATVTESQQEPALR